MQPPQGQPPQGYGQPPQGYGQPPQGYGQPPQGYPQGPAAAPNPAQTAGIIMLVCALLLAVGLFTKGWASASEGRDTVGAGLFGFEGCGRGGQCQSIGWDEGASRLDIPSDVGTFRIFGLIAGIGALLAMLAVGGMALSRNLAKIPVKPTQIVLGLASGFLTYFAFRLAMSDDDVPFGPSYSAFLAIGGLIGAGAVLQKMLRPLVEQAQAAGPGAWQGAPAGYAVQQPMQQQPMQQPVQQQPVQQQPVQQQPVQQQPVQQQQAASHPCPHCQSPLQWVDQYQRWYCGACQQYA